MIDHELNAEEHHLLEHLQLVHLEHPIIAEVHPPILRERERSLEKGYGECALYEEGELFRVFDFPTPHTFPLATPITRHGHHAPCFEQ